jgi:hypothetical protein
MSRFATTLRRTTVAGDPDGRICAGWAVISARPGAARGLFVAGTILVAAHVTLLVFDPRALFLSNLFNIMYPPSGGYSVRAWRLQRISRDQAIVALIRVRFAGRSGW